MSNKLFYLMTYLPTLPALGQDLPEVDALAKIRDESDEKLLLLADLLEAEEIIKQTGMQFFVLENKDFKPELSERLPENFVKLFYSFKEVPEAEWLENIYFAWFALFIELSNSIKSDLLAEWAQWEYSLRLALKSERLKTENSNKSISTDENLLPGMSAVIDHGSVVESWKAIDEPMQAEKFLDQYRIDFLRNLGTQYTFAIEELIAYMLELRIHNRYARLSLDEGRKILEEVTAL
ncbi:MAG: hypothetical protein ACQETH_02605 [Candidatus Rifleibacteriota bacterium]